jgi:hypothetical protein
VADSLLLKVTTDQGLEGRGEAFGFRAVRSAKLAIKELIAPPCIEILGSILDEPYITAGDGFTFSTPRHQSPSISCFDGFCFSNHDADSDKLLPGIEAAKPRTPSKTKAQASARSETAVACLASSWVWRIRFDSAFSLEAASFGRGLHPPG